MPTRICHMVARSREEWAPVCAPGTRRGPCQPGGAGCPTAREERAPRPRAHGLGAGFPRAGQAGSAQGWTPRAQGLLPANRRMEVARKDAPTGGRRRTDGPRAPGPRARAGRSGGRHCGGSSPFVRPTRQWAARRGTCSAERPINRRRVQLPSRPSPRTGEPSAAMPGGGGSRPPAAPSPPSGGLGRGAPQRAPTRPCAAACAPRPAGTHPCLPP